MFGGYFGEVGAFLVEPAADLTVGVLGGRPLPRRVRIAKVHLAAVFDAHACGFSHFHALVPGDGLELFGVEVFDHLLNRFNHCHRCVFGGQMTKQGVAAGALYQGNQRAFATFADNKISFPVSRDCPVISFWAAPGDFVARSYLVTPW